METSRVGHYLSASTESRADAFANRDHLELKFLMPRLSAAIAIPSLSAAAYAVECATASRQADAHNPPQEVGRQARP